MYANLKTEMDIRGISMEELSRFLEIHRNSVSNKINGSSTFSIDEAFAIRDKFFPYADVQYLFKRMGKRPKAS